MVVDKPGYFIDIFLHPGELYFGNKETRIRTLLGSCVAITLWHPRLKIGGMCHYMLPENRRADPNRELDGRYADEAMQLFMQELDNTNTQPKDYEVKMFGGGNQFPDWSIDSMRNISHHNINVGRQLLLKYGFHLMANHLGGTGHRNLIFDLWSGHVWMRHVENNLWVNDE